VIGQRRNSFGFVLRHSVESRSNRLLKYDLEDCILSFVQSHETVVIKTWLSLSTWRLQGGVLTLSIKKETSESRVEFPLKQLLFVVFCFYLQYR